MIAVAALRSTSELRRPRALKTASREIFRKSRASQGRSAAYRFGASRENAYAYEKARQDRQSLQTDPIGYEDQWNLYAYVGNDPVNLVDPTGKQIAPDALGRAVAKNEELRRNDPEAAAQAEGKALGLIADAVAITLDVVTVPSGEGAAIVAARRAAVVARRADKVCCFAAGTLVHTKTGLRAIEGLVTGDLVLSKNDETGEEAYKPVTELIRRHERIIWTVTVADANGETHTFETTDDHPWWLPGVGWKRTDELEAGALATADGLGVRVVGVENTGKAQATYNLEVADFHTYFVGEDGVWVHNACPNPHGSRGAPDHRADGEGPGFDRAQAHARPGETVLTEQPVQGHPGVNRRADNQVVGLMDARALSSNRSARPNGSYHRQRVKELEACGMNAKRVRSRPGNETCRTARSFILHWMPQPF